MDIDPTGGPTQHDAMASLSPCDRVHGRDVTRLHTGARNYRKAPHPARSHVPLQSTEEPNPSREPRRRPPSPPARPPGPTPLSCTQQHAFLTGRSREILPGTLAPTRGRGRRARLSLRPPPQARQQQRTLASIQPAARHAPAGDRSRPAGLSRRRELLTIESSALLFSGRLGQLAKGK